MQIPCWEFHKGILPEVIVTNSPLGGFTRNTCQRFDVNL